MPLRIQLASYEDESIHPVYFPGDVVSGWVIFTCDKKRYIEYLKIKISGVVQVAWTIVIAESAGGKGVKERGFPKEDRRRVTHSETEHLIDEGFYALGNVENDIGIKIDIGSHVYPFEFTMPLELPNSYRGAHGEVKYEIKAVVKRSAYLQNYEATKEIHVSNVMDLDLNPRARQPGHVERSKKICLLCCKSGPIGFNVRIPRKGYVSGEVIRVTVEVINESKREVGLEISILQKEIVRARKEYSDHIYRKITEVHLDSIKRAGLKNPEIWETHLTLPENCPPTNLGQCRLIKLKYYLDILMHISGSKHMGDRIPLQIGSIPLSVLSNDTDSVTDIEEQHNK